jgi:hypothetical protein
MDDRAIELPEQPQQESLLVVDVEDVEGEEDNPAVTVT